MKILYAAISPDKPETAFCRRLVDNGLDHLIICAPESEAYHELSEAGAKVVPVSFNGRIDPSAVKRIRHILDSEKFDIIHATTNRSLSNCLIASRDRSLRIITYRGTTGHLSRLDPASWLTYFHPRVSRIVCVSEAVRLYLLSKRLPPSRLVTIHKGHDLSWYEGIKKSPTETGIPENVSVVCFTGNMRPVKGIPTLLKAADLLPPDLNCNFLLVGEVRDRRVKKLIRKGSIPPNVHFAGFRADAPALAGGSDIFVMSSTSREGLCKAVIEAMAQGVPAVVTKIGGMPEVVTSGKTGLIVPPRDPGSLARAIEQLLRNPDQRRKMGRAARLEIMEKFNVETTISRTLDLYSETLAET